MTKKRVFAGSRRDGQPFWTSGTAPSPEPSCRGALIRPAEPPGCEAKLAVESPQLEPVLMVVVALPWVEPATGRVETLPVIGAAAEHDGGGPAERSMRSRQKQQ
jgi:hypothetical protein